MMLKEKIRYRDASEKDIPFMKEMLVESCFASGVTSISVDNLHEHPKGLFDTSNDPFFLWSFQNKVK